MWECSLSRGSARLYSSPLLLCKAWVHKQHPGPLLGLFVGGVCRNAALLCFIYDKICRFNFAVVRVWICDSFFLVCSAKSSGSLTPSTLADVFRCYVLCGLSELNILFWAFRDSVEPTDFSLTSFNQVFFSVVGYGEGGCEGLLAEQWCKSALSLSFAMPLDWHQVFQLKRLEHSLRGSTADRLSAWLRAQLFLYLTTLLEEFGARVVYRSLKRCTTWVPLQVSSENK